MQRQRESSPFQNEPPAGHERDGHNFFEVADEDEFGGFLVVSPEGMADVGEREQKNSWKCFIYFFNYSEKFNF